MLVLLQNMFHKILHFLSRFALCRENVFHFAIFKGHFLIKKKFSICERNALFHKLITHFC